MPAPEVAIIIPTLNEAASLPLLLEDLARQRGVEFEVLVSDGGSQDATRDLAGAVFTSGRLAGKVLETPRGRGRQMNAGAAQTAAAWLLFLHADSRLPDAGQLRAALDLLQTESEKSSDDALAGRFVLRFDADSAEHAAGYVFFEAKARLGRRDCIHGDQGLLLPRSFFQRIGRFREDLPIMEDTSLAEGIRDSGRWFLLPGEIVTSARRFNVEGLQARQTLNALLLNFRAIDWLDFIEQAPGIYRQQDRAQPLQLQPFFRRIDDLLAQMPLRRRFAIWWQTGRFVRRQVWQLGLALDCRGSRRLDSSALGTGGRWLAFFDRWVDPLTDHVVGRGLTTLLVWGWFRWRRLSGS